MCTCKNPVHCRHARVNAHTIVTYRISYFRKREKLHKLMEELGADSEPI